MHLIAALNDLCLASVFGTCYWTRHNGHIPLSVMFLTCMRAIYYHSGTAALGALPFICRMILSAFRKGKSHPLRTRVVFCIVDEAKTSNHNPYVLCAIHGTAYGDSAFDTIDLLKSHVWRAITVDIVICVVLVFWQATVTVVTGAFAWILFRFFYNDIPVLAFIVAVCGAFMIVTIFASACCVSVHTMILCIRE